MTDTPRQIAEAMHKLAGVMDRRGSSITARAVREAFPIHAQEEKRGPIETLFMGGEPIDDGPNGLGWVVSPDDVEPAPVAPDDMVERRAEFVYEAAWNALPERAKQNWYDDVRADRKS